MQTIAFALRGEFITLDTLLKATGLAGSGGGAKTMVAEGRVQVDRRDPPQPARSPLPGREAQGALEGPRDARRRLRAEHQRQEAPGAAPRRGHGLTKSISSL